MRGRTDVTVEYLRTRLSWSGILDLSDHGLVELPPEVERLETVTVLRLCHNKLRSLPPGIARLTKLRELHACGNALTEIPPEIGELVHLQRLALTNNELTSLPAQLSAPLYRGLVLEIFGNPLPEVVIELATESASGLATYLAKGVALRNTRWWSKPQEELPAHPGRLGAA